MLPNVTITKQDGNTGVVKPATVGVIAIIAAAAAGPSNQPGTFTRQADAVSTHQLGPLCEYGAYWMQNAKKPAILIRPTTSVAATYSSITFTGTGTSVVTAGATAPADDYNVTVTVVSGGTIGVAGITFKYTLDGGENTSALTALGTANTYLFNAPVVGLSTGVTVDFGAGTLVAGDTFTFTTTRPKMNNSDLVTALEALRVSRLPWDAVLIDADWSSTLGSTLDSWLAGLEGVGKFKYGYMNTRHKNLPVPSAESEATFATAMGTLTGSSASIRYNLGTDAGDLPSPITGLVHPRPVSLGAITRAGQFAVGVDPAYVANGPIPGFQICDDNSNPKWHDEALYPGLDDLRLTTFRSFNDEQGTYLDNARVFSPNGSDYVYDQHARCMNVACTIAYSLLTKELSRGVQKQAPDPTTGKIYILETEAAAIEALVNPNLEQQLKGQVVAVALELSRTDDLSSNAGAQVNAEVQVEALAYIKGFVVSAKFVKTITVTAGG
ncbi:MAG TPA: DUF2586 family protein [Polyangiaceae bacterium]